MDATRRVCSIQSRIYILKALSRTMVNMEPTDASGYIELGRCHREGDGVPKDPAKAIECFLKAAEMGDASAASTLGYMYMSGEGCTPDDTMAEMYLRTAADAGVPAAMCNLGFLLNGIPGRESEAIGFLESAANAGSVTAMKNLAVMYGGGNGVPMDKEKSIGWYMSAIDAGDLDSMCALAFIYRAGDGVPEDKQMALELYGRAAEAGDVTAQYEYAFMLDSGEGVPEDHETAEVYFRKAADAGDTDACLCMGGILFEKGEFSDAEHYFLNAAMKGDVKAQYNLGLIYMADYLGSPDPGKATEWFEASAEQGFVLSFTMLGNIELDAGHVDKAASYFRTAAQAGEPTAMYNLGALGISGQIEADFQDSLSWIAKSAEQGFELAYNLLSQINSQAGP